MDCSTVYDNDGDGDRIASIKVMVAVIMEQ